MSREITFENIVTENLGHIKDVRLKDSGFLYISDYYKLEDGTNLDMVVLKPEEVIKLKDFLNESNTKAELKEIVDNGIEQIFVSIAKKYKLKYGDMDPGAVDRLDTIQDELLEITELYLKGNSPEKMEIE